MPTITTSFQLSLFRSNHKNFKICGRRHEISSYAFIKSFNTYDPYSDMWRLKIQSSTPIQIFILMFFKKTGCFDFNLHVGYSIWYEEDIVTGLLMWHKLTVSRKMFVITHRTGRETFGRYWSTVEFPNAKLQFVYKLKFGKIFSRTFLRPPLFFNVAPTTVWFRLQLN